MFGVHLEAALSDAIIGAIIQHPKYMHDLISFPDLLPRFYYHAKPYQETLR